MKDYFAALATFQKHGYTTKGNTRSAFADLLKRCCGPYGWHLVEEYNFKGTGKQSLRADGALVDDLTLQHGIWEAKDNDDDLEKEIKSKRAKGYPLTNTLFQSPSRAVLYQGNRIAFDDTIATPEKLVEVLETFFTYQQEHEVDWEDAVTKFAEKIPDLANGVTDILAKEYTANVTFRERFAAFAELCRQSINPDLSDDAIRKMLVQHLLTERIFRKVFNNPEFTRRNVIAAEIEKVIDSITARHFSRDKFFQAPRPLLHRYREGRRATGRLHRKAALPQSRLRKVFPALRYQTGRHPRHRPHSPAHRSHDADLGQSPAKSNKVKFDKRSRAVLQYSWFCSMPT